MKRSLQLTEAGRDPGSPKKGDEETMILRNLMTVGVVAVAICLSGCRFLDNQLARISDVALHPFASLVKQHYEVCQAPSEVKEEGTGIPLGVKFPVAKPGDCGGDRMMIVALVADPKVHEEALRVSTGQEITVEGVAVSGMRLVASSITPFKVRREREKK